MVYLLCHTVDIPMSTNCAPILSDALYYSEEAGFLQGLLKTTKTTVFKLAYRYTDDVLSLNNAVF